MTHKSIVYIVEDDPGMRRSLVALIQSVRLQVEDYDCAQSFLEGLHDYQVGCLILDLRLPGMSGRQLQQILLDRKVNIPIIFISGHGDLETAVEAMKHGAFDFIEKPYSGQRLLDSIQSAIRFATTRMQRELQINRIRSRMALLTEREREVLSSVIAGRANKVIASQLGIGPKTVEFHRARVMAKMQAENLVDLIRMVLLTSDLDTHTWAY